MFRNVLVAVDGSAEAQKAVEWALNACEENPAAEFALMYVHQPYLVPAPVSHFTPIDEDNYRPVMPERTPAHEALSLFAQQDRVHIETVMGNPADEICRKAEEGGYDVIVLGSRGHGVVASVLLGSVSAKVLHHAPCSVLIVR